MCVGEGPGMHGVEGVDFMNMYETLTQVVGTVTVTVRRLTSQLRLTYRCNRYACVGK